MPSKATTTDCAFLRSKNTFSSKSGSLCFWYCLEAETEPLLDDVRPLSQPTLALVRGLGDGIADAGAVGFAAQLRGIPGRLRIGGRQEDLVAKRLQQCLDAFIGQRVLEAGDALRGDDGDALRLSGDGQEAFVAGGVVAADRGEVLVLIADKDGRTIVSLGVSIHPGDTQLDGTLVVNLHHGADGLRQRRIQGHGKVQANDRAGFDQFIERRQDDTMRISSAWLAVVEFLRRTEDTAHVGVGLEEREEDHDALDDGGL